MATDQAQNKLKIMGEGSIDFLNGLRRPEFVLVADHYYSLYIP